MYSLSRIENNTARSLLNKVNDIWAAIFTRKEKGYVVANDYIMVRDSEDEDEFKKITAYDLKSYFESSNLDQLLIEWTQGKDYEPLIITRDLDGNVVSMTVKWPDESSGVFTSTDWNVSLETYDGYNITHVDSSKTIIQSSVTRNVDGAIINKPLLTII